MECREFPTVGGGKFPKTVYSIPNNIRSYSNLEKIIDFTVQGGMRNASIVCHVSFKDDLQVEEHNKTQVKYSLLLARSYWPTDLQFLEIYHNASVDGQRSSF